MNPPHEGVDAKPSVEEEQTRNVLIKQQEKFGVGVVKNVDEKSALETFEPRANGFNNDDAPTLMVIRSVLDGFIDTFEDRTYTPRKRTQHCNG